MGQYYQGLPVLKCYNPTTTPLPGLLVILPYSDNTPPDHMKEPTYLPYTQNSYQSIVKPCSWLNPYLSIRHESCFALFFFCFSSLFFSFFFFSFFSPAKVEFPTNSAHSFPRISSIHPIGSVLQTYLQKISGVLHVDYPTKALRIECDFFEFRGGSPINNRCSSNYC